MPPNFATRKMTSRVILTSIGQPYYTDLNLPLSADEFVASLKTQLTTALTSFERFMAKKPNDVTSTRGEGRHSLTARKLAKKELHPHVTFHPSVHLPTLASLK
ncbi:hypothetical protein KSF_087890 [Reticulibacter mediterranei]|uniref:Uncharacterized protein n=1 Tax=Reticulibacter mediterranei TaxID=2778369 RepID=A0A8J3IQ74_9CHLR|nr:hypothetical protein [Reticulibacter mediterranei]GHO98741.1 hypothetical protein KSF_087890 [Reticulibacter mediterranei]